MKQNTSMQPKAMFKTKAQSEYQKWCW